MTNLGFIPSSTAVNFRAYCESLNAALKMGLVELDQLCKEGGLNDLFAMQNQVMADAALEAGEAQASATRMNAYGQIAGGVTSLTAVGGGELRARSLQKEGVTSKSRTTLTETTEGVELKTKADKSSQDSIDSSKQLEKQEKQELKDAKTSRESFDAQAANARQMGQTLAHSLSGLSSGAFGIAAASDQANQALAEQLKTLANGGMDQANRAIQLLTSLIQLIKEQKDLAIQTQAAIAQATHA